MAMSVSEVGAVKFRDAKEETRPTTKNGGSRQLKREISNLTGNKKVT